MPRGNHKEPSSQHTMPQLPPVDSPQGAIAEAHQRRTAMSIPTPRGLVQQFLPNTPTSCLVPHSQSAMWFKEIYWGYMAAQSISYAATATDSLKLFSAETTELATAATNQKSYDDSLAARSVAIWLLARPRENASTGTELMLDALSAWGNYRIQKDRVVNHVRMSALFGTDATFLMEQVKSECTQHDPIPLDGIRILVRWHDGTRMRSSWRDLPKTQSVSNSCIAMQTLQNTVVRISGTYDIKLPAACMRPGPESTVSQAFYHNIHAAATDFFKMLEGTPSISFSKAAKDRKDMRILQPTGVFVRVVDKRLGEKGIKDHSCFNGVLLAISDKKDAAAEFALQSDSFGLRLPISADEVAMGVHLCAVQAEGLQLGRLVSLFGTLGLAGKPIHSPNSWVWVSRPAIREVDGSLLGDWGLFPCSMESMIPGRSELIPAFERFWKQTTNVFKLMGDGEPLMTSCVSTDSIDTQATIDATRFSSPKDIESPLKEDAIFMASMQVDMSSQRTTLGDAYAQVMAIVGNTAITANMKQAMALLGVRASLKDMFEHNQRALAAQHRLEHTSVASALMGLCEVAVDMAPGAKRARTIDPKAPLCLPPDVMRRILKTCGLKGGDHLTLERGKDPSIQLLKRIISCSTWLDVGSTSPVASLMQRPLMKLSDETHLQTADWLALVEQAVAMASATAMVALQSADARLFFVVSTVNREEILIKTVELNGTVYGGLVDDMCRVKHPRVIILQQLDDARVRVTATLPIA